MATSTQAVSFSNIGAGNTAAFALKGGKYGFSAAATWGGGNVQLQALAGDGSTWINVGSALVVATPYQVFDLPPGQYRISVTTATAVYVVIDSIPT